MTEIFTLFSTLISLFFIAWLVLINNRRRQMLNLPESTHKLPGSILWLLVILPGFVLLMLNQWSAFVIWLGATPLFGWIVVLKMPANFRKKRPNKFCR